MQKNAFFLIWLIILLIGPYTILSKTPIKPLLQDPVLLTNLLQRLTGLIGFSLIFIQVILGAFMTRLTQKLGGWIYKFHITEGVFTYFFILGHPLLAVFLNYKLIGKLDPFYVFTDICIICKPQIEYFYTFGRVAFWFLTIAVGAAYFRTHPWLRVHWLKFHILNFLAFYLIALHAWSVGSDVKRVPFVYFFTFAVGTVSLTILYKLLSPVLAKIRGLNSKAANAKLQK